MKYYFKKISLNNLHIDNKELFQMITCLDKQLKDQMWNEESWLKTCLNFNQNYFLSCIIKSDRAVGFCLFESLETMGYVHILKVVTDENHRRIGLADMLLRDTISNIKESSNIDKILLEVDVNNAEANALYSKHNFKNIHLKRKFYSNGNNARVLELLF